MRYLIKRAMVIIIVISFLITIPGLNQAFATSQQVKIKEDKETGKIKEDKEVKVIEEKINILMEKEKITEEDIKEMNLLIKKIEDIDIKEKYKKILSELEKKLDKNNIETNKKDQEEDSKDQEEDSITDISKVLEKVNTKITIDTEEKLKEAINSDVEKIIIGNSIELKEKLKIERDVELIGKEGDNITLTLEKSKASNIIEIGQGNIFIKNLTLDGKDNCKLIDTDSIQKDGVLNLEKIIFINGIDENLGARKGGAIYIKSKDVNIKDCIFKDNKSKEDGGVIYASDVKNFTIKDSKFEKNNCVKSGGAIYLNDNSKVTINNTNFTENNSKENGGAIYIKGSKDNSICIIENSCFYKNSASGISSRGGAIAIDFSLCDIQIKESKFKKNEVIGRSTGYGGAIFLNTGTISEITGGCFKNNEASDSGGAIYNDRIGMFSKSNIKQISSKFEGNNSKENGGAIYIGNNTDSVDIKGEFEGNKSEKFGGAIYIGNNTESVDIKGEFEGNNSKENGGAIYSIKNKAFNINNSTFNGNNAEKNGGVIYTATSEVNINESTFNKNNAEENGGAVNSRYNSKVNIKKSAFNENVSEESGGALYTIYDNIKIYDSNFEKNKSEYGSAITMDKDHLYKSDLLEIYSTKFDDNYSDRIGTLYIKTKDSKDYLNVNIDKSVVFSNNKIKENRRFINGFSEDKYKGYKDDLTKNIKTISSSLDDYPYEMKGKKEFQQTPFNNIDINILDYEYFISHNNPEGMKGYYDVEVYKGEDQGELKFKNDTILEFKKLTETEKQKIKATLKDYSLNRYDKLGEIVSNEEDAFKINSNDIDVNGIWDIEILDREPLEEKIDIKFNANGGIVNNKDIDIIEIDKGSRVESQKVTREGYKFLGWFKNLEDEKAFDFKEIINEDLELFAKWEKIEEIPEKPGGGGSKPSKPNKPKDKVEKDRKEDSKKEIVVGKISERLNRKDHMRYLEGYPDGTIRPNADITREEVSAVLFRLLDDDYRDIIRYRGESCPLYDVHDGRWSKKHINTMINGNIVKGFRNGKFYPDRAITRAELITMIDRLDDFKYTDKTKEDLKDIKGHWAEKAISSGIQKGWVIGFEDDTFRPDDELTRAEFTVVMNRILNRVPNKESIPDNVREYKDLDESDWYYYDFVEACNCHKYEKNKDGTMDWKGLIDSENEM